jgi:hypothetical protein
VTFRIIDNGPKADPRYTVRRTHPHEQATAANGILPGKRYYSMSFATRACERLNNDESLRRERAAQV